LDASTALAGAKAGRLSPESGLIPSNPLTNLYHSGKSDGRLRGSDAVNPGFVRRWASGQGDTKHCVYRYSQLLDGRIENHDGQPSLFLQEKDQRLVQTSFRLNWLEIDQEWNCTEEQPRLVRSSIRDLGLPCE